MPSTGPGTYVMLNKWRLFLLLSHLSYETLRLHQDKPVWCLPGGVSPGLIESALVGLRWGPTICISSQLSSDANAVGPPLRMSGLGYLIWLSPQPYNVGVISPIL